MEYTRQPEEISSSNSGDSFIPRAEINARLHRLQACIERIPLHGALIFEPIEILYYTGSMPNGVLFVPAEGEPALFVRRNIERARRESPICNISAFTSFKEILAVLQKRSLPFSMLGIDERATTLSYFKLLKKYFVNAKFADIGHDLQKIRAVKSAYEIEKLRQAAEVGRKIMSMVPELLVPGISEWELAMRLFHETALLGGLCIPRLAFNSGECFMGGVCFGDSSNRPSSFDGPDGMPGKSPICPHGGSDRRLQKGDLIFVDMLFPYDEYYIDKTRIFSLGQPEPRAKEAHEICLRIQEAVQYRLRPGAIPSRIYDEVFDEVVRPNAFEANFMGFGSNQVKFLGHGVGMVINEYPVIARKSDDPLEENMILAVEPKKGLEGLGMVGIENTFLVAPNGGVNLTQDCDEIVIV
jgi:Xaa-Pro dipeptidase